MNGLVILPREVRKALVIVEIFISLIEISIATKLNVNRDKNEFQSRRIADNSRALQNDKKGSRSFDVVSVK
jgi:hypothetical protein